MADPGFVKREDRESKCRVWKTRSAGGGGGGGDRHIFFCVFFVFLFFLLASFTLLGIGVPYAYQTDLPGEKKKRPQKKGGGAAADLAPLDPPLY